MAKSAVKKNTRTIRSMRITRSRRYVKQTNNYNCGPTAIYNLLLWGDSVNWKNNYRQLNQICNPVPEFGTGYLSMNFTIRRAIEDTPVKLVNIKIQPKYQEVKDHLYNGGSVIINFHWRKDEKNGEHYVFIDECNENGGFVINDCPDNPARVHYSDRKIKLLLSKYFFNDGKFKKYIYPDRIYPKVWFFKKL